MKCTKCESNFSIRAKFCGQCGEPAPQHGKSGVAAEAKEYAMDLVTEGKVVAKEAVDATKVGMKTEMGKSVAACAALGAVIALPIPLVGPLFGATVGAIFGVIRKI